MLAAKSRFFRPRREYRSRGKMGIGFYWPRTRCSAAQILYLMACFYWGIDLAICMFLLVYLKKFDLYPCCTVLFTLIY